MNSRLFISLIFVLALSFSAYNQVFAPLGAKWTFVQPDDIMNPLFCRYSDKIYSVEINEEREINGYIYNVLGNGMLVYREDSQRVYYYENNSVYLLMDFNLTVGDTLKVRFPSTSDNMRYFNCCYTPIEETVYNVIYKDTAINVAGKTLRQLHFSSYYLYENSQNGNVYQMPLSGFIYTERIGAYSQLLSAPYELCCAASLCYSKFLCYQDNEWGYDNDHAEYNCLYTSVENKSKLNGIDIYPNPADKTLNIRNIDVAEVSIIHLDGRIMFQNTFQDYATMNTEKLHSGVYYVAIKSQHNTVIKKIVISH
jgi:hypothetical protein